MALFSGLGERLNHIFSKLTNKGRLTSIEVKEAMREIKLALLEADVNFLIVKKFIDEVSELACGEQVLTSLTPGQQVIKIVNEKLTELMGSSASKLVFNASGVSVIMLCGLQGAGKTTMAGKLAYHLKGQGKKVMLAALDIYRPAAIEQLKIVAGKANSLFYEAGKQNPVKTTKEAIKEAEKNLVNVLILDTAGRLHINEELMTELKEIKKVANPVETLLVVDSTLGQDAVNVAEKFNNDLDITGVIVTKLDGDTRGGAALSIKQTTGKPIKFSGIGEKISDLEVFHPDRMASRILGMGDVLTLIEKAQVAVDEKEAQILADKFKKNAFTLDDYLHQMESIKKMGGIKDILKMIPGAERGMNLDSFDEKILEKYKVIILSMTKEERLTPEIIKASRKERIAKGSGTSVVEVNKLLKQFEQGKEMMKQMKGSKGMGMMKNLMGRM